MKGISEKLTADLEKFGDRLEVGIIAIADKFGQPIIYTSKIDYLLGYESGELIGKTFARLLPPEVRGGHLAKMENFKKNSTDAVSRPMFNSRPVPALTKVGDRTDILVSIAYYPPSNGQKFGIYLAFVQDPANRRKGDSELNRLKIDLETILYSTHQVAKFAWKALLAKITATGGILGFATWILTQVTPLGTALKAAGTAFQWNQKQDEPIGVYEVVDESTRHTNLTTIRNIMRRYSNKVVAIAYYRFEEYGLDLQLKYIADTGNIDRREVWFADAASDQPLLLTDEERRTIFRHECLQLKNVAFIPSEKGRKLDGIACPTMQIAKDAQNPTLKRVTVKGLAIAGVDQSVTTLEPYATILWQYLPNVENIF